MGSMDRTCLGVSVFFGNGLSEKKTGLKGGQEGAKWRNRGSGEVGKRPRGIL
jgi:hypothetical protein